MNSLTIAPVDITSPTFGQALQQLKALEGQLSDVWKDIEAQMSARSITKLSGDWGYMTFAERVNWKVHSNVSPYYLKPMPDTKKLNAAFAAGEIPTGADFSTTVYLTKRIK